MTTSVLQACGELNEFDLQVIQDYAIEAPSPWRNALEQLVAAQKRDWVSKDQEEEIDELKAERKAATEKMQDLALGLERLVISAEEIRSGTVDDPVPFTKKHHELTLKLVDQCAEVMNLLSPEPKKG